MTGRRYPAPVTPEAAKVRPAMRQELYIFSRGADRSICGAAPGRSYALMENPGHESSHSASSAPEATE
jgi:hypothetical protein